MASPKYRLPTPYTQEVPESRWWGEIEKVLPSRLRGEFMPGEEALFEERKAKSKEEFLSDMMRGGISGGSQMGFMTDFLRGMETDRQAVRESRIDTAINEALNLSGAQEQRGQFGYGSKVQAEQFKFNTLWQDYWNRKQLEESRKQFEESQPEWWAGLPEMVGRVGGAIAGGAIGGPVGAMAGAEAGGGLGGMFTPGKKTQNFQFQPSLDLTNYPTSSYDPLGYKKTQKQVQLPYGRTPRYT